ncbi:septum formation family protein [Aeromicrobium ginsengisoli]|uniref:DUF4190 domain-containing protein n=1 Tax=Aeromicrobium ginsengisoli TaxID=363867 RepID=A0A5M4FFB7_9ACTN|nr:septum formation family protein [Aeromicrobium ginsengisoli]KAA1398045.1 DUF4190 domain-containing protein [Aeromicrobium ginsengisoli]
MTEQDPPAPPPPAAQQPPLPAFPAHPAYRPQDQWRSMPPPTKTKAGWALGLALVPGLVTWIISLILSIQVISDSKRRPGNGKGMAIAALIIIPVWICVIVLLVVVDSLNDADRDTAGVVTHSGEISSNDLRPGDCTPDDLGEKTYLEITVTPCTSPHFHEAYAEFDLAAGDFPGQAEVSRLANAGCVDRFESFVGKPYADSQLDVLFLRPVESSWTANRAVTCLVSTGSSTTGTLEGSKR